MLTIGVGHWFGAATLIRRRQGGRVYHAENRCHGRFAEEGGGDGWRQLLRHVLSSDGLCVYNFKLI